MNTSPGPTAEHPIELDRKELLEAMDASFSLEELSTICFNLGIDIDNLEGAGKSGKARELIEYCLRSSRVQELLALCKEERPEVDWEAFVRPASTPEAPDGVSDELEGEAEGKKPEEGTRKWLFISLAAVAAIAVIALVLWGTGIFSPDGDEHPLPAVSFRESVLEVDESQGAAEFTVELGGSRADTVTIPYETKDDTATAGEDYEASQGVLTFNPDEDTKTITIPILPDDLDGEEVESLQLVLTDLEDRPVAATLTIKDNPSSSATIRVGDLKVSENQGEANFIVQLGGNWIKSVKVLYETSDVSAAADNDYEETGGALLFNPGESEKTISVPILLDWLGGEGDETFGLVFRNDPASNVELPGLPVTATLTIEDYPPPTARFVESALSVDEGQDRAEFTVEFLGSWPDPVTLSYQSDGGSATAGEDYEETRGVLTFSDGAVTKTIAIPVVLDELADEGDQTVQLVLKNDPDGNAQLPGLPVTATLTIEDHPPPTASLAANTAEVSEGQEVAELVVELDGSWPEPVRVPYETGDVTAAAGDDYEATQGGLTFNPGETSKTITIPINDDNRRELDEKLNLTIREAPFVMVDGDRGEAVVIIKDDGDTESACSLAAADRIAPDQEILMLGFRAPGLYLRREPSTDPTNIIKTTEQDEVLCVIDSDAGWYRIRLTDTVTDGWIGQEFVYTIVPPRLLLKAGTASIPFWDADAEPGCRSGEPAAIVGNVGEADVLRVSDRNGDGSCFEVQLTIDGRVGWVQSRSIDTTRAVGVEFVDVLAGLELRRGPDDDSIGEVRQEQILWASASGLDERCLTWYKVRLKDAREGWLGGSLLIPSESLQQLPREVNHCVIDSFSASE